MMIFSTAPSSDAAGRPWRRNMDPERAWLAATIFFLRVRYFIRRQVSPGHIHADAGKPRPEPGRAGPEAADRRFFPVGGELHRALLNQDLQPVFRGVHDGGAAVGLFAGRPSRPWKSLVCGWGWLFRSLTIYSISAASPPSWANAPAPTCATAP